MWFDLYSLWFGVVLLVIPLCLFLFYMFVSLKTKNLNLFITLFLLRRHGFAANVVLWESFLDSFSRLQWWLELSLKNLRFIHSAHLPRKKIDSYYIFLQRATWESSKKLMHSINFRILYSWICREKKKENAKKEEKASLHAS